MSILACLALFGQGYAQVSDVTLGYCSGQVPGTGTIKYTEPESWVSGAIYIPAGTINTYAGNTITGVKAGLTSRLNMTELKVWLRSSLDGENLVEKTITKETDPKIAKGWNEVLFDTPWEIPADSETGIYIGYSYYQTKAVMGMGVLSTPTPGGFFLQFGDQPWEDRSNYGTLCVEGLVRGDKLPKVNLALTSLSVPEVYIIDRGTLEIGGTVKNLATYTITGFDMNAFVDGEKVSTAHIDTEILYGASGEFVAEMPLGITSMGDGTGSVTVTIDNINEGADEDMSDNTLSADFAILQHDFKRRILVEEFTTEKCPNCPRLGTYMHDALEKDEFKDDVIAVCHHAGYYTDWLTTSFDAKYLWLFNDGGSTYAPAMAVDRTAFDSHTSVSCPSSSNEMENAWKRALKVPAFVSLNIMAEFDDENENLLRVKVTGAKTIETLCDNPTITVFIVEDNISAVSQAGAANWTHQHVNRAVNSTWGDPVVFEGDNYEYECEFALMSTWKREDMQIVAFIANFNDNDAADCEVQNTSNLLFSNISGISGADSIEADENVESEIYSISGMKMNDSNLAPGLYIRKTGNKTEKFMVK